MNPISGGHSLDDELYNKVCGVKGPHLPGFHTVGGGGGPGISHPSTRDASPHNF